MGATNDEQTPMDAAPKPTRVNTERRNLYLHHTTVVAELAGKDDQFKEANAKALASARQAKNAKETLTKIRETESQLSAKLEALQKRKLRNKLFPKKAASQTSILEQNLAAVSEDAATAKYEATKAKEVAKADARFCNGLKVDAETLKASVKERRDILEDVFRGKAGNEEENTIESERDRLARATDKAKDKLTTQKKAYGLLRQAEAELTVARNSLADAQVTNTVDMFSGGGIGIIAGIGSQYHISEAAKLAQSAGQKIQEAVDIQPKLPISKLARVQNGVVLGFADIALDGFVTDLLVRATIEKSIKSVNSVLAALKESLSYQQSIIERLSGRYANYSNDLKRTSEDLDRVRADLLQDIIIK